MEATDKTEPIAVIGMACRFPGEASSIEKFWDMISNGCTGHGPVPDSRFNAGAFYHPHHERRGAIHTKHGFFIEQSPAVFDAPFFSITAKEAAGMDPMQRMLLEISYETLENAGISMSSVSGSETSVYTGVMTNDFERLSGGDMYDLPHHAASGTSRAMLANRVSWFYNMRGPSLTLDTACSSSLYAFHLACQSLRTNESAQAMVLGANLILHPSFTSQLSSMHMLSPDGISHSFDSRANGYARGDAVAGVLLKPLSKALDDGDTIRAIVRGTGTNQDGKTPGITMPSGEAQARLIRTSYAAAGLDLDDTMYFEAHGTGTALGDPIELSAIGLSFGANRNSESPALRVGSVKTNIGHTEGAAGLAGLIKAVLALERGLIPPNAGLETINPQLKIGDWKIALPRELEHWPTAGIRRASVNSFGFGGSNAHAILDDALHYLSKRHINGRHFTIGPGLSDSDSGVDVDSVDGSQPKPNKTLLVMSSHDQNGNQRVGDALTRWLKTQEIENHEYLQNLAYTLGSRRTNFPFRSFAVVTTMGNAPSEMSRLPKARRALRNTNVAFVFTGQGAQWPNMGRELFCNPAFSQSIERSQRCLALLGCDWAIATVLCGTEKELIQRPEYCQPICTALQIALVDLIQAWGIKAEATVGHSSGEIAAAYAAGALTHESAMKIAYFRGLFVRKMQERLPDRKGGMLAAGLAESEALECISMIKEGTAVIGCVNSPTSVTLTGDLVAIDVLETMIKARGKFARKLRVDVAYHSPHMEVIAQEFLAAMGAVETYKDFKIPMFSSVTTRMVQSPSELDAVYWVKNMVSAVRFSPAVETLFCYAPLTKTRRSKQLDWSTFIEIGPHDALKGLVLEIAKNTRPKLAKQLTYATLIRRGQDAEATSLETAGLLWSLGHSVDVDKVNDPMGLAPHKKCLIDLPSYPWQHSKEFWHSPSSSTSILRRKEPRDDLLGSQVDDFNPLAPDWRNFLQSSENPWMEDHVITGTTLYPGAGHLIMVMEAAVRLSKTLGEKPVVGIELQDVSFDRGLVIPAIDEAVETRLSIRPHESKREWFRWTIYSLPPAGTWTRHSYGLYTTVYEKPAANVSQRQLDVYRDITSQASKKIDPSIFYSQLRKVGMEYGPLFTNVIEAAAIPGAKSGRATISIPDTKSSMPASYEFAHMIHPATLDAIFHLVFIALHEGDPISSSAVPVSIEDMYIATKLPQGAGAKFIGCAQAFPVDFRESTANLVITDAQESDVLIRIKGMHVREVSSGTSKSQAVEQHLFAPQRAANLKWLEDTDFLTGESGRLLMENEAPAFASAGVDTDYCQLNAWLLRFCHKTSRSKVLIVSRQDEVNLFTNNLGHFLPSKSVHHHRFAECAMLHRIGETSASSIETFGRDGLVISHHEVSETAGLSSEQARLLGSFDLIIASSSTYGEHPGLSGALKLLRTGGHLAIINDERHGDVDKCSGFPIPAHGEGNILRSSLRLDTAEIYVSTTSEQELLITNQELHQVLVLDTETISDVQAQRRGTITTKLLEHGFKTRFIHFGDETDVTGETVLSLLELETPIVAEWEESTMEHFKTLVLSAGRLLWLTRGGFLEHGPTSVAFAPTTGLLRTVRTEVSQLALAHVDLSPATNVNEENTWDLLASLLKRILQDVPQGSVGGVEGEYVEFEGQIYIPRVVTDSAMDRDLELHSGNVRPIEGLLHTQSLVSKVSERGDVVWQADHNIDEPLGDDYVEIRTSLATLRLPGTQAVSHASLVHSGIKEAAGVVLRAASNVTELGVGDHVILLTDHAFRTNIRQHQKLVHKVSGLDNLEWMVASLSPYMTASRALLQVARLTTSDVVLIHGGTSAIVYAMVQVLQSVKAKVLISTSDAELRQSLIRTFGLSEKVILDDQDKDLSNIILSLTHGKGVDVLAHCGTGISLRYLTKCIAGDARVVFVDKPATSADLEVTIQKPNVVVASVDTARLDEAAQSDLLASVVPLMRQQRAGHSTDVPTTSIGQIQIALDGVKHKETDDCTVLEFGTEAVVPILPPAPPALELSSSATYILAGGLGALGLTIAAEMAKSGARHLVFLSRSGATQARQLQALEDLRSNGCRADAIACDITDRAQVESAVQVYKNQGCTIKGLVQCAMILRDAILQNLDISKWRTATRPKILGSWNLHAALPPTLDFFIILSSISGIIGNTAQANYAAGNTYEDALAHHRRKLGLAATSLNIGLVTDASHFSVDSTIEDYLKKFGHWASATVSDCEMQVAIRAAMRGTTSDGRPVETQVLIGMSDAVPRNDQTMWAYDAKFNHRIAPSKADAVEGERAIAETMAAAESAVEVHSLVESALKRNIAAAMTADEEDIDTSLPLYSFGVDSLKAIEVRNWIYRELKCDVSVFTLLSPTPLGKLARVVAVKSELISAEMRKALEEDE